jgi:hypothetical protein
MESEQVTQRRKVTAEELRTRDWPKHLGFDPAIYDIDVAAGMVKDEHIGIVSAAVCATAGHEVELSQQAILERGRVYSLDGSQG